MASSTDATDRRDHALFHLLLATGLRLSSALALRVEEVDLEAGEIEVTTTKNSRPTLAYLGERIREHLREYVGDRVEGELFPMDRRHAHRRLRHWLERAGIRRSASPHALRHSFATALYEKTGDLFLVKSALHHASIASTVIYAAAPESRIRAAMG